MINKILLQSVFFTVIILVITSCGADEEIKVDCSKITNMSVYSYSLDKEFNQGYDDTALINEFCNLVNKSKLYTVQGRKVLQKYRFYVDLYNRDSLAYCLQIILIEYEGACLELNSNCNKGWYLGLQRNNDFIPFFEKLLKEEDSTIQLSPLNIKFP